MTEITSVDVKNKKVIVRVDYNVSIKDGVIEDDERIKASLDTINYLLENDAKIILLSHLKRIKKEEDMERYSLEPVAKRLSELVKSNVYFIPVTRGEYLEKTINNMKNKDIILVENTRFEDYPDQLESNCDDELSKYWASLGDIFVLDAFASSHRNHASTYGISKYIPGYAGVLVNKEKALLDEVLDSEKITLVLGGSKVTDKILTIDNLIKKADKVLIGGAMCFTFLKADGKNIGSCPFEKEHLDYAKKLLENNKDKIILPIDFVCDGNVIDLDKLNNGDVCFDIGPKTVDLFKNNLKDSELVLWNGPLGKYEEEKYINGTKGVLEYLRDNKYNQTILAGGDIIASASKCNVRFPKISTGGGATLEYLGGKTFETFEILK